MATGVVIVGFLTLLVIMAYVDSRKYRCDYVYEKEADGYLKYQEIPANFAEARLRCQMEGAKLASPLDAGLMNAMRNLTGVYKPNCGLLTGINSVLSRGDFASVEGVPLANIPHTWAQGEPDNYMDQEQCIAMNIDGTMSDESCKEPRPYICYKKGRNFAMNSCGTTDPDYTLDGRSGSCYKFHRVPRTWSRAYMACMAEGAYLAVINSKTESQIIAEIFAKNPPSVMVGNFGKDVAFVGFQDYNEHGEWITIQGDTLKAAGFDTFQPGEPNNYTTGEFCGSVYRTGYFDDIWCETRFPFICEKDPTSLLCDDNEDDD